MEYNGILFVAYSLLWTFLNQAGMDLILPL